MQPRLILLLPSGLQVIPCISTLFSRVPHSCVLAEEENAELRRSYVPFVCQQLFENLQNCSRLNCSSSRNL